MILELAARHVDLADVRQTLQPVVDIDEEPEVGHVDHPANDVVADAVAVHEVLPLVGQEILDREGHPLSGHVDVRDPRPDRVALRQHLARVLHALGPAHVRDVDEAVDLLRDLDEGAELGQVAHPALDNRADREPCREILPRVRLDLAQREADPTLLHVELRNDRLDLLADADDLGRRYDLLCPRHLADVNQALDTLLQLHEGAVVDQADHPAAHPRPERILLVDQGPRVLRGLLVTQRDTLGFRVETENDDPDLIADPEVLRGMVDPAPGDVRDVEQAVDAAQVDEDAVVRDVLDHAWKPCPLLELGQGLGLLLGVLLLENRAPRQHDVVAPAIQADHLELEFLALERLKVLDRLDVHQGTRQEGTQADIDGQASLDAIDHTARDHLSFLEAVLDLRPDSHALGLDLGQHHVPVGTLCLLEQHLDIVADADLKFVAPGSEFVDRHQAFGLVADVHDDVVRCDRDHPAGDDLPFVEMTHAVVVHLDELLVGEVVGIGCLRFRGKCVCGRRILRKGLYGGRLLRKRLYGVFFGGFHGFLCSRFGRCDRAVGVSR